jgi:hypothetical protein
MLENSDLLIYLMVRLICMYSDNTGARFSNGRIIRTKVLYKGLVKVGESADGGDNYGISNQVSFFIPKGENPLLQ